MKLEPESLSSIQELRLKLRVRLPRLDRPGATFGAPAGSWAWILALALLALGPGCEKLKTTFRKAPVQGVAQQAYPIGAYAYQLSLVIHASPSELIGYFAKDLTWLEEGASTFKVEASRLRPHTDMTEPGQSVDFSFRVLGINFPCRLVCLQYRPEEEWWWMMALSEDSWILLRFRVKPIPEGCQLHLDVLGQPPQSLEKAINTYQLLEAVAGRADLIMTVIQAHFDPKLDVAEATPHGLRGELTRTFLQGYDSSIWVPAPPFQVIQWIAEHPAQLDQLIPNLKFQGKCQAQPQKLFSHPEAVSCPSTYQVGSREIEAIVLSKGRWVEEKKRRFYSHNFWIVVLDNLIRVQLLVQQQGRGSEIKIVFATELGGAASMQAMDLMLEVSQVPQRSEQALLQLKTGLEGGRL